jgi:hypothetical protein
LEKWDVRAWTGLIWLGIGTSGGLLWVRWWTSGLPRMWGNFLSILRNIYLQKNDSVARS